MVAMGLMVALFVSQTYKFMQYNKTSEVLIDAVQREDQNQLRHLLAKSAAHVNVLGQEGDSPLHRSCRQGNLDTVKLLVSFLLLFPFPVNWFVHVIFNDFLISLIDKIGSLRSRSGISQPRGMEPTALGRTQRMRRRRCLPFVPHAAAVIKNRLLLDSSSCCCCCCRMSQVKYSWMAFECCWNPESFILFASYCVRATLLCVVCSSETFVDFTDNILSLASRGNISPTKPWFQICGILSPLFL